MERIIVYFFKNSGLQFGYKKGKEETLKFNGFKKKIIYSIYVYIIRTVRNTMSSSYKPPTDIHVLKLSETYFETLKQKDFIVYPWQEMSVAFPIALAAYESKLHALQLTHEADFRALSKYHPNTPWQQMYKELSSRHELRDHKVSLFTLEWETLQQVKQAKLEKRIQLNLTTSSAPETSFVTPELDRVTYAYKGVNLHKSYESSSSGVYPEH